MNVVTNSYRCPRISGRRLYENFFERRMQRDFPIHYRIQCDAAGQTELIQLRFLVELIENVKANFFESRLQRGSNVLLLGAKRLA